jgi:hypothetical protein
LSRLLTDRDAEPAALPATAGTPVRGVIAERPIYSFTSQKKRLELSLLVVPLLRDD